MANSRCNTCSDPGNQRRVLGSRDHQIVGFPVAEVEYHEMQLIASSTVPLLENPGETFHVRFDLHLRLHHHHDDLHDQPGGKRKQETISGVL